MKPFLSIVIPIRDEGELLINSILSLDYMLSLSEFSYECIFLYSNATKESKLVCEKFSKLVKYTRVQEVREHKRWGAVFLEGMNSARGNLRMFLDPHAISIFSEREKILQKIKDGYDCVIAIPGVHEKEYIYPDAIPRMLLCKEELVSFFEAHSIIFGKRRVALAEAAGALLEEGKRIYAIPFKEDIEKIIHESFIDKIINRKKIYSLKRKHKKIRKK
jgi:hypothetical protein